MKDRAKSPYHLVSELQVDHGASWIVVCVDPQIGEIGGRPSADCKLLRSLSIAVSSRSTR